jgi:hypothetical protein
MGPKGKFAPPTRLLAVGSEIKSQSVMDGAALLFISRFTQRPNNFLQTPKAAGCKYEGESNRKLSSKTLHKIYLPPLLPQSKVDATFSENRASMNKEALVKKGIKTF